MFDADHVFWKFAVWAVTASPSAALVSGPAVVVGTLPAIVLLKSYFDRLIQASPALRGGISPGR